MASLGRASRRIAWSRASLAVAVTCAMATPGAAVADDGPATGPPVPLQVDVRGANGEGRIETPGRTCADGGDGAYWNYDYGAPLAGGVFSAQPGDLRLHLALHSDEVRFPNTQDPVPPGPPRAFLQGTDSQTVLANSRGTLVLRMRSGSCDAPTLSFDGVSAAGPGTWEVAGGDGSYRDAAGGGTFSLTADVAPGADNPFALQLAGQVAVLQPSLKVEVIKTYWGSLGTDYLTRRVTVVFRITNLGPGDAFAAKTASITSPTPGVTPLGGANVPLGDLPAGESEVISVRFQLGLLGPCALVILGCNFDTKTTVSWADALDVVSQPAAVTPAKAPTLPPPL